MFNSLIFLTFLCREQPPPRGCVLKRRGFANGGGVGVAAASARLCVETCIKVSQKVIVLWQPPPRGCVLKQLDIL